MTVELHFTLGPVQAFIAESRRTRDLWVGSYLLSYLAGRALAVAAQHGDVVLPALEPATLRLYEADARDRSALPAHASLPNRFVVACANMDTARQAGSAATAAVTAAWRRIEHAVWKRYVEAVAERGAGTEEIWKRQVTRFWEMSWVVGNDPALLDQRKHWRGAMPPEEPGDHCTMMGRYQELSGYVRRLARGAQDAFWEHLRTEVAPRGEVSLDLRDNERLCAIALIKRLLPRVAQQALGRKLDEDTVGWPSTLHVAAWPWIEKVCKEAPEAAAAYAEAALRARKSACGERKAAAPLLDRYPAAGRFPSLDGNFFFLRALRHERDTPLDEAALREPLAASLRALQKHVGSEPSPFFGLLLMDGDRMGELLRQASSADVVTRGLTLFARQVPEIVGQCHGATVYAGGDDVLTLLPVNRALDAALALASAYASSFAEAGLDASLQPMATLSGAIVYAHYRLPLRRLLDQAHELLDDVAKARTGRASLAMAVHRSGGETARWSVPWAYLRTGERTRLGPLIERQRTGHLGKSVLYRLRARVGRLSGADTLGPGRWLSVKALISAAADASGADTLRDLIAAEIENDRERNELSPDSRILAEQLLDVCCQVQRSDEAPGFRIVPGTLSFDGAVLAHFLATGGLDGEDR